MTYKNQISCYFWLSIKSIAYIANLLYPSKKNMLRTGCNKDTIDVIIDMNKTLHMEITDDYYPAYLVLRNNGCVLLDDAGMFLPKDHYQNFLKFLSEHQKQIILTVSEVNKKHFEILKKIYLSIMLYKREKIA